MHIEKCSIKRTETRTREMYACPSAIGDLVLGDRAIVCWPDRDAVGNVPVTLTYPAPVQVDGVRVEVPWSVIEHDVDQFLFDLRGKLLDMIRKPASPATQHAQDFPGNLIGKDSYRPNPQPATLPWHDLGPGLSVAVVEGKGAYRVRLFAGGWMSLFMAGDGSLSHVSDDRTLAAAKAACDDHHAKGGA